MLVEVFLNTLEAGGIFNVGDDIKIVSGEFYFKEFLIFPEIFGKKGTRAIIVDYNANGDEKNNFDVYFIPKTGGRSIYFNVSDGEATPIVEPRSEYVVLSSRKLDVPKSEYYPECEEEEENWCGPQGYWVERDSCYSVKCRYESALITDFSGPRYYSYSRDKADYRLPIDDGDRKIIRLFWVLSETIAAEQAKALV